MLQHDLVAALAVDLVRDDMQVEEPDLLVAEAVSLAQDRRLAAVDAGQLALETHDQTGHRDDRVLALGDGLAPALQAAGGGGQLEGHNARLAARRKNQVVLKRIAGVLARRTKAAAAGQYEKLPALNASFHHALAMAGENEVLGEMLQRLRERTEMFFDTIEAGRQQAQWADRAEILRAILDGNESRAAMLAAEHVIRAGAGSAGQDPAEAEPQIPMVE